jgi:hypothetical protein
MKALVALPSTRRAAACGRKWAVVVDPDATHRNPTMWGPSTWALLLDAAAAADDCLDARGGAQFMEVLRALRTLLPCSICRGSFCAFVASLGPRNAVETNNCVWLIWSLKNLVNDKLANDKLAEDKLAKDKVPVEILDVYNCLEQSRRSTSFDRALLRGVFFSEAELIAITDHAEGLAYHILAASTWTLWMDLADRRADLPACRCASSIACGRAAGGSANARGLQEKVNKNGDATRSVHFAMDRKRSGARAPFPHGNAARPGAGAGGHGNGRGH